MFLAGATSGQWSDGGNKFDVVVAFEDAGCAGVGSFERVRTTSAMMGGLCVGSLNNLGSGTEINNVLVS